MSSLIFDKGCPLLMITALSPIGVKHILMISSFFSTIEILAEYGLLLGRIIPLLNRSYIFCFIFLCMPKSKVFGLAVMENGCTKLILCFRTLVCPRSLLFWATTFLNYSNNLLTKVESWLSTYLVSIRFSARCR